MTETETGSWQLNKSIIALLAAVAIHGAGMVWWASQQTHRLATLEATWGSAASTDREREVRIRLLEVAGASTEQRLNNIVASLVRIERMLETAP